MDSETSCPHKAEGTELFPLVVTLAYPWCRARAEINMDGTFRFSGLSFLICRMEILGDPSLNRAL